MMNNIDLADELRAIANLMIIAGEDEFRARRISRLADDIETLPEPIEKAYEEDRLEQLSGVGKSTATMLTQILETGTCDARDKIEETVPLTVLDLLEISGIGVKTAKTLYDDHGIKDIETLDASVADGTLAQVKGFSAKKIEGVKAGIERIRRRNIERPLQEVLSIGEQIAETLNTVPDTRIVSPAGDARRGREYSRQVRLVVGTDNIGRAAVALGRIGLGDGSLKTHVRGEFGGGFPIHVHLTPNDCFGAVWLRESCDRVHLDALNARASERGLPTLGDEDAWKGLDEAGVYEKLGYPYVPPELREGVAALELDALPRLITVEDYVGDLHSHTVASDGANTIEEMAEAAKARGYKILCVTDHSRSSAYAGGLTVERLLPHIDAVRAANDKIDGITLLAGSEVDILPDGSLDYDDDILAQLDWVVASVHSGFNLSEKKQTDRIRAAMENPHVRIIGHPTGRLLSSRDPYPIDVAALIEKAAETGVAIELNSSPERLDLSAEWCAKARQAGVLISINTDAHRRETFANIRYGMMTARRAWLEPQHVLNTRTVDEIVAFRSEARS
ncbi:MAG: PHP domain-containing protein [Candidatus Poribacteria bacterium]|nr:PHP domain-containing protein [Candidatus Poribacteria bacterium]